MVLIVVFKFHFKRCRYLLGILNDIEVGTIILLRAIFIIGLTSQQWVCILINQFISNIN
jgi:hypothetical protein